VVLFNFFVVDTGLPWKEAASFNKKNK